MTAADLLDSLTSKGCWLRIEDGELRVRAPQGILTEEIREQLKSRKRELVTILTSHPCGVCGRFRFSELTVCYLCRPPASKAHA